MIIKNVRDDEVLYFIDTDWLWTTWNPQRSKAKEFSSKEEADLVVSILKPDYPGVCKEN